MVELMGENVKKEKNIGYGPLIETFIKTDPRW